MINKKDIEKMVKHITKRDRGIPDKRLMHPAREWGIVVILAFAAIVAGGFWSYLQFMSYSKISLETQDVQPTSVNYDRTDVRGAIDGYRIFSAEYESLMNEVPEVMIEIEEEAIEAKEDIASSTSEVVVDLNTEAATTTNIEELEIVSE